MRRTTAFLGIFLILLSCLSGCGQQKYTYTIYGVFDTVVQLIGYDSAEKTEKLGKQVEQQLSHWNALADAYHPYEGVEGAYALADGKWHTVHKDMMALLQFGVEAYQKTEGVVNLMCGAVTSLWKDTEIPPSETELQNALRHISIESLELNESENTVRIRDPEARIDLGAFAKGYALEQVGKWLESVGFHGILSASSSVVIIGKQDSPAHVGIGNPVGEGNLAVLNLSGTALATAGTHQRFFTYEGKNYHHIIDLSDGYPAKNGITQVSVVAPSAGWADVYATAYLITGQAQGDSLVLREDGSVQNIGNIEEWM